MIPLGDIACLAWSAWTVTALLIIAAVVLPLLGLLIFFSKDIMQWVRDLWDRIKTGAPDVNP